MMIKRLAREELKTEIQELGKMELGSEEYKTTVDGITKLWDRVIEVDKIEIEADEREKNAQREQEMKLKQMRNEKTNRIIEGCIDGVEVLGKIGLVVWGTYVILSFEKEGTVTTGPGRAFVNSLFRFIK